MIFSRTHIFILDLNWAPNKYLDIFSNGESISISTNANRSFIAGGVGPSKEFPLDSPWMQYDF